MSNAPSTPAPAGQEWSAEPVKHSRTARDMTLSLLVLLIPLALIVAVFRLRGGEDTVTVDPAPAIAQAQAAKLFAVAAPRDLGSDWQPISALFSVADGAGTLRVGYITPSGGTVQLVESNEGAQSLLGRELGDQVRSTGEVTVSGATWRSSAVRGNERALVLAEADRTLIVVGQAPLSELTALAEALHY